MENTKHYLGGGIFVIHGVSFFEVSIHQNLKSPVAVYFTDYEIDALFKYKERINNERRTHLSDNTKSVKNSSH